MATATDQHTSNGRVESVNLSQPAGIEARAEVLLAGAIEKVSNKDPEKPRPYWVVLAEPPSGGDALYIFTDRTGFEECAKILASKNARVPGVMTFTISRRGQNYVAFSPGEKLA